MPHWFVPATVTFPVTAELPKLTIILLVPAPEAMVAPDGTVHEYDVTPTIGVVEYTTELVPAQTEAVPVMAFAALGGEFTNTVITVGDEAGQPDAFV